MHELRHSTEQQNWTKLYVKFVQLTYLHRVIIFTYIVLYILCSWAGQAPPEHHPASILDRHHALFPTSSPSLSSLIDTIAVSPFLSSPLMI